MGTSCQHNAGLKSDRYYLMEQSAHIKIHCTIIYNVKFSRVNHFATGLSKMPHISTLMASLVIRVVTMISNKYFKCALFVTCKTVKFLSRKCLEKSLNLEIFNPRKY